MFADDTNWANIKLLLKTAVKNCTNRTDEVKKKGLLLNKLSLNESKTKFLLFGDKKTKIEVKKNSKPQIRARCL